MQEGHLKKGDKLPSVNSIKNRFSLSRDTVFTAFGELKQRGIVEAVSGKGYYIKSEDIRVVKKIFLLFDELNTFKEDLYNSFLNAFDSNVQVDIYFHHFNKSVFEKHINDNIGDYNYYVIMPANLKEATTIIRSLPKDKVFLLDQTNDSLLEFASVHQNFEDNVFKGLNTLKPYLAKYDRLVFVNPKSIQPKGINVGFRNFVKSSLLKSSEILGLEPAVPKKGEVYFILDDRSLIELIKKIQNENLIVGSEVGIIAYNDSLLKEIVEGGITTISTNFTLMGERMAQMILNEEMVQVENPNEVIIRNSL